MTLPRVFSGGNDPEGFLSWAESIDNFIHHNQVSTWETLRLATSLLRGEAKAWWNAEEEARWYEEEPLYTWEELKVTMGFKYVPNFQWEETEFDFDLEESNLPYQPQEVYFSTVLAKAEEEKKVVSILTHGQNMVEEAEFIGTKAVHEKRAADKSSIASELGFALDDQVMQHENKFEDANSVLSSREHQKKTEHVDFTVGDASSWNSKSKTRTELLEVLKPIEERGFQTFSPFNEMKFLEVECGGFQRSDPLFDKVKDGRGVTKLKRHHKSQWSFDGGKGKMALFSIQRLFPFDVGESDLRTNPLKGGGNDAILMNTKHEKEIIMSVAGPKLRQTIHSSHIRANSDKSPFKQAYLSNQKDLSHEPIFCGKLTQQSFFWMWNHVHNCSESKPAYFTIKLFSFRPDSTYGPEIELCSSTQQFDRLQTTWKVLTGLSWFQQAQEHKKWPLDPQVIIYFPKQVCLIHFREISIFAWDESLQNYLWRPGDILNQLEVSKNVFTSSSIKEVVQIRTVARVEATKDQLSLIGLKQEFLDKESFRNLMGMFVIKLSLFLASFKSKKSPTTSLNFPALKSDENEEEN